MSLQELVAESDRVNRRLGGAADLRVCDLMIDGSTSWNESVVLEKVRREVADKILKVRIAHGREEDELLWTGTQNSAFSVKTAFKY